MDRRTFPLTIAAAAQQSTYGRLTAVSGEVLVYSDPFQRGVCIEPGVIRIRNGVYPEQPTYTRISLSGDDWAGIFHRGYFGRTLMFRAPIILPDEEKLETALGNNLSLLTTALLFASADHPEWWRGKVLFQRALDSAMKKPTAWRCAVPDFTV